MLVKERNKKSGGGESGENNKLKKEEKGRKVECVDTKEREKERFAEREKKIRIESGGRQTPLVVR